MVHYLVRRTDLALPRLVTVCWALCAVGWAQFFLLGGLSSAWAFRTYELFDTFSIVPAALLLRHGSLWQRWLALLPGMVNVAMYAQAGLLPPYAIQWP